MLYDVIIIGAGAAGLSAGIYTSRRNLKTLILSKDLGGQASTTPYVENYPGFRKIGGFELMKKFEEQAKDFGIKIIYEGVKSVKPKKDKFTVQTSNQEYEGRTLILAFGKSPRTLNVSGEKEFSGKGVSYCATCDAPLFRGRVIAVVGGGNSAIDAALLSSEIGKKVYLIHRRDKFSAFESLVDELKKKKNVEFVLNHVVVEFKGDKFLKSIIIENVNRKEKRELEVGGVIVEIGSEVKTDFIKSLVKLDEKNQILINNNCETSHPGIFAAGDVTNVPFKQIVVSAGEGAKAGLQAYNYLHGIKGPVLADWAKLKK